MNHNLAETKRTSMTKDRLLWDRNWKFVNVNQKENLLSVSLILTERKSQINSESICQFRHR